MTRALDTSPDAAVDRSTRRRWWRRPRVVVPLAVAAVTALAVGLWLFAPWALILDDRVDEPIPTAAAAPAAAVSAPASASAVVPSSSASQAPVASQAPAAPAEAAPAEPDASAAPAPAPGPPAATAAPPAPAAAAEPIVLAEGALISHEHEATGAVRVLQLADGSRILRLEDLSTSNGPDLRVWITDAPVIDGEDGWHVFDDGRYVDLGGLTGNLGSSNYPLPPDLDLRALSSVSIWCDRFNVSFGAAQLAVA